MLDTEFDEMEAIRKFVDGLVAPESMPDLAVIVDDVTFLGLSAETDVTDKPASTPITPVPSTETEPPASAPVAEAETPDRTDDGRPIIYVKPGHLQGTMRAAERCLARTGHHFQRGGSIVTVRTDPATGESQVQDLHPLALVHALDGVSAWMRPDKRGNTWSQVNPDERICNVMVKVADFHHLPILNGIARQPYLRPDGSLCDVVGHDPATGLYGVFDADVFDVPAEPSREQAQQALALLNDLLSEFEFASPHDRSASLAAMLTAAVRPSLALAPLFHVRAPQIASGKSYLCELITVLATPQRGTPVGFPNSDEECDKLLLAQLVRSPAVIEFDNLTSDLKPYKKLCTALTSERMEGRILRATKMVMVSTRVLFLSSGNNVGPVADMTRRCLTIHLDPGCEVPAARTFKRPHLIADVQHERGRYVSAALTVVRAWIVAGRPESSCRPLANFVEWSDFCRQSLIWLGQPDPAKAVFEGMAEDPEHQTLGRLLAGWHEMFGEDALIVRELLRRTAALRLGADEFSEVLLDIAGDRNQVNPRTLGNWFARHAGRVVDGLRLVKAPKTRNAQSWRVESVVSVVSVSDLPASETGVATA